MMKRRQMLGIFAACALALTGCLSGYAGPVTYDQTADAAYGGQSFNFDAGTPTIYPGDKVYGQVTIYLGSDNAASGTAEQLETDQNGTPVWTDKTAAVYKVTDVTAPSTGETEMVPQTDEAGNPVLGDDGSQVMQAALAASPSPAYQLDIAGYAVEAVGGKFSGETGDWPTASDLQMTAADGSQSAVTPQAKYYAEGSTVTLTADQAPDGLSFAGWTVTEIKEDGTVSQVSDVSSLNLSGLTADAAAGENLTFTMGEPDHVLIFAAQYAQAQTAQTEVQPTAETETQAAAETETAVVSDNTGDDTAETVSSADAGAEIETQSDGTAAAKEGTFSPEDGIAPEDSDDLQGTQESVQNTPSVSVSVSYTNDDGTDGTVVNPYSDGFSQDISTAAVNLQGQKFDHWESQDASVVFADPASAATTVTFSAVPAADVTIQAVYSDAQTDSGDPSADSSAAGQQPASDENQQTAGEAANPAADGGQQTAEVHKITYDSTVTFQEGLDASQVSAGTNVTATANVPTDKTFSGWTVSADGVDTSAWKTSENPLSFEMPAADVTITPVYTDIVKTHSIIAGSNVTLTLPDGVNADSVPVGTAVTATADTSDPSQTFSAWSATGLSLSADQSKSAAVSFSMPDSDVSLNASYSAAAYTVTAAPGSGKADSYTSVSMKDGGGQDISSGVSVPVGTQVTVTLANTSARVSLSGTDATGKAVDITDQGNGTFTFTMPAANVTLTYSADADHTYTVNVSVNNGSIIGGNGQSSASGSYLAGTEGIKVKAADAPAGKVFNGWTVSDPSLGSLSDASQTQTTLKIVSPLSGSGNLTLTANYKDITYNLTVVSGNGTGQYTASSPASISADAPKAGYRFSGWTLVSGNGSFADQTAASTTFTCSSDAKIQANYEQIPYKITVKSGKPSGTYTMGEEVSLVPDFPAAGKEFDKWSVTSGQLDIDNKDSYYATATVKASDATVTALYKNGPSPDSNAITGLQNDMEYLKSSTLTFNAVGAGMDNSTPNPGDYRYKPTGYQIGSVTGSWNQAPYQTSMAINAVGDYTLTVNFAREVYDGKNWNADGTTDSKSITIHVVNSLSVATGDTNPIMLYIILGLVGLAVVAAVVIFMTARKRRRN